MLIEKYSTTSGKYYFSWMKNSFDYMLKRVIQSGRVPSCVKNEVKYLKKKSTEIFDYILEDNLYLIIN